MNTRVLIIGYGSMAYLVATVVLSVGATVLLKPKWTPDSP
jgi:hypothetical protein